jgi:hypothetical protein
MMTALSLRLDLMNQRGFLADARRAVKFASDDLRSVLNLHTTETINVDKFDIPEFSLDVVDTEVGLELDLPLNRKAQRNVYREALINFQVGRRALMRFEDDIKLAVRDDLRALALARAQYHIGVASAALANERVKSTRIELALGIAGIQARDFLEAQDAFRLAVSGVADNHLGYISSRVQLFFDLELMQLDEGGFWPELRDESQQPQLFYQLQPEAGPAYGPLVPGLWYSREIRSLHPHRSPLVPRQW